MRFAAMSRSRELEKNFETRGVPNSRAKPAEYADLEKKMIK